MHFSLRGKERSFSWMKVVGILIAITFCVGMIWFVHRMYQNFVSIRSGLANPVWQRQLQSTISRSSSNPDVKAQDIARVTSLNAPRIGNPSGTLAIVEFLDFDCPYCRSSFTPVRELMEKYKDRVSLSIRDFPVTELHPRAILAALAARCAHEQGKFWLYHDQLFANQDRHEDSDFLRMAREVGLDMPTFEACYQAKRYQEGVNQDLADGLRAGVQGTPTFFFNGIRIQGALDQETMESIMLEFLRTPAKPSS